MSSATSTEPGSLGAETADTRGANPALQLWQLFTLAGLIGATVVVFMSRGQNTAGIILLSLTVLTAAILGMAAWRMLAPLTGQDPTAGPQVIGGRTRAALEREKTLVLRSIKELEFDRAMGKVSEKDFIEVGVRLRARAARLLRQLDAGTGYREQIEKDIARRVGELTLATSAVTEVVRARTGSRGEAGMSRPTDERDDASKTCPSCRTNNDTDARFCKKCGIHMEPTA